MKSLRDFLCKSCEEVTERYIDSEILAIQCHCGQTAHRMIGTPNVKLEGITGDFPDAHAKWAKIREDNKRIKDKRRE
jgi:hypothetical protein